MLSIRVFGEDITKPHTANLHGKNTETAKEQQDESLDATENQLDEPVDVKEDEEADLNA
jgi:hypothetical protein